MRQSIYASAQDFGFGPASTLYTYLTYIKEHCSDVSIYTVSNPALDVFCANSPSIVDAKIEGIPETCSPNDLVLSSFDPTFIVKGWLKGLKTVYVCNLFWFWNVDTSDVVEYKKKLLKYRAKYDLALDFFQKLYQADPHSAIFLGYLLADVAYVRRFPNCEKMISDFSSDMNCKLTKIVLNQLPSLCGKTMRDKRILVQLSGSKNPFVNDSEHQIYIKFVETIFYKVAAKCPDLEFCIIANPRLIQFFQDSTNRPRNAEVIRSLEQDSLFKLLSHSIAMFTSPGLESIYEAIAVKTPVFLLPEQNTGQYYNYELLNQMGIALPGFLYNDIDSRQGSILSDEKDAPQVYSALTEVLDDEDMLEKIIKSSLMFINKTLEDSDKACDSYIGALEKVMGAPFYESPAFILNELEE